MSERTVAEPVDLAYALRSNGSVRAFRAEAVTDDELFTVLDHARFAPSGGNKQGWRVVVLRDAARRNALLDLMEGVAREYVALMRDGQRPFGLTDHGRWPGPGNVDLAAARAETGASIVSPLRDAPVLLVVCVDTGLVAAMDAELDRHGIVAGASIYPFCQNVLLSARLAGLGGVLTTFAVREEARVKELVQLPDTHAVAAVIALGHPETQVRRLTRNPVASFTTLETFDGPAFPAFPA
jgi:nitroreductase